MTTILLAGGPGRDRHVRHTPKTRRPWPVVLASAQRAPRIGIVIDLMPAHARTRGCRKGLVAFAVAWSFHERTPYADGPTLLSRHGEECGTRPPDHRFPAIPIAVPTVLAAR